jgi:hypothetical protein
VRARAGLPVLFPVGAGAHVFNILLRFVIGWRAKDFGGVEVAVTRPVGF